MASNSPRLSPRQKMINLMYIVLTAMLALNVSSDVLDGFSDVEKGVRKNNEITDAHNKSIVDSLMHFSQRNPEKGAQAYNQAVEVEHLSDQLVSHIDSLKLMIVKQADGDNANLDDIVSKEDLEAASVVMLNPLDNNGTELRQRIDTYREKLVEMLGTDNERKNIVERLLTTEVSGKGMVSTWEQEKFDNKPVIAAVTLLSQLQNNIKTAEGEVLQSLLDMIDAGDVRVNSMQAFVIPRSRIVMRGGQYVADIVMAAVDTTDRPIITVNGNTLDNGSTRYVATASTSGEKIFNGTINLTLPDGSSQEHPFSDSYTVIEPMATVSATMMNVLYAGIDNPVSISVPGVPSSDVSASATNATISRSGNEWILRPSSPGKDVEISVTAKIDGKTTQVATHKFKVRRLPDPTPYISFTDQQGAVQNYTGGRPLNKNYLLSAQGLGAAIDDGILNIGFKVNGFETVFFDSMGNALVEVSNGAEFSQRQKDTFRRMARGKRFYISKIKATGPDGVTRDLAPLEVIIN